MCNKQCWDIGQGHESYTIQEDSTIATMLSNTGYKNFPVGIPEALVDYYSSQTRGGNLRSYKLK